MYSRIPFVNLLVALAAATNVCSCWAQTPSAAPAAVRVDDKAPGWIWDRMSSCTSLSSTIASAHAGGPGSSATYIFTGTGVTIYGVPARTVEVNNVVYRTGKLRVTIDGQVKGEFPEYAAGQSPDAPLCTIRNLAYANHSIYLEPVDSWAGVSSLNLNSEAPSQGNDVPSYRVGSPFHGPHNIPGTVESEDYDLGGRGIAFNQNTAGGQTGYRQDNNSAIETKPASSMGYDLGYTDQGQWARYTVNVAAAGTYVVTFRVASPTGALGAFHLADAAGNALTAKVDVPNTGGWWTWMFVSYWITLRAGQQVLTLMEDTPGWNVDNMTFGKPPQKQ